MWITSDKGGICPHCGYAEAGPMGIGREACPKCPPEMSDEHILNNWMDGAQQMVEWAQAQLASPKIEPLHKATCQRLLRMAVRCQALLFALRSEDEEDDEDDELEDDVIDPALPA